MPALANMLRPHAHADPRADLVTGNRGGEEIAPRHAGPRLGDGEESGQGDGADMEDALAVHVVELEALDEGPVDQCGMRRREARRRAPDAATGRAVDGCQRLHQQAAPLELGPEDGAT